MKPPNQPADVEKLIARLRASVSPGSLLRNLPLAEAATALESLQAERDAANEALSAAQAEYGGAIASARERCETAERQHIETMKQCADQAQRADAAEARVRQLTQELEAAKEAAMKQPVSPASEPAMKAATERASFEQWAAASDVDDLGPLDLDRNILGLTAAYYASKETEAAWFGWQARAESAENQVRQLTQERDEALQDYAHCRQSRESALAQAISAENQVRQLQEDAARYRWLRNTPPWHTSIAIVKQKFILGEDIAMLVLEDLDAAIDAAMQSEKSRSAR